LLGPNRNDGQINVVPAHKEPFGGSACLPPYNRPRKASNRDQETQNMTVRPEEELCQKAFERYLQAQHGIRDTEWEPEPNGETTVPDFHMHHGGLTYAVEITALMTQSDQAEGEPVSKLGIWKTTERLAGEIEQEAIKQGLLRGGYTLTMTGPYHFFRRSRNELKEVLMDFIARTRDIDEVRWPRVPSVTRSGQHYFLQKESNGRKNFVEISTLGDDGGWSSNIVEELSSLVQDAIASKVEKLRAVPPPRVLLLLDRYYLATDREYADVRDRLLWPGCDYPALHQFQSIYLIHGDNEVFLLYPLDGHGWNSEG
jgi:hypothetical protein